MGRDTFALYDGPAVKADFLDFCYEIDNQKWRLGMGKDNLMALANVSGRVQ